MKQSISRFCLSLSLYWFVASFAGHFVEFPDKVINIAAFVPPVLGLMWGLPAALGVYFGALLVVPDLHAFLINAPEDWLRYFVRAFWAPLAGFLPYVLWHKVMVYSEKYPFLLSVHTLKKFIVVMLATFVAASAFRALVVTRAELEALAALLEAGRVATPFNCFVACFINDFFVAIFVDLAWFFFLVSREYPFVSPADSAPAPPGLDKGSVENFRAWRIALFFYMLFPVTGLYVNHFQIYGMERIDTWLPFIAQCLTVIDVYLVLMLYLLLRYRRSIMLEVVFLVTQTVFFTAAVLGLINSVAMGNLVNAHTDESLRAMSVICRERLFRTFFCVRQAVNGMKRQAVNSIESYDRLANDAAYREAYLTKMQNDFSFIPVGIDGSISYYLRLKPEIAGTKGGFSMQRDEARWEGALSPFSARKPIDLALYSPDDLQNVGWYYIPMKSRCATWIEPYVDAVTNFYVISYVAPLFVEGQFVGVVGMDIDFNFIIQELRRMSIYDYGYVYIMNRNNIVLYHRDQPQGALFQSNPDFQEIELYLTNGMWLGIATPLSRVYDSRNDTLMNLIAAIVLVAMLISLGSISLASKAIKPLAGMTEAAKRIASGDLNVKISYESGNELGILVRSIREMAAKLEFYVYRDKLTGLRNAAAYMSKSAELDERIKHEPDLQYGVVIFDANFLKKVNDNYGHEAGNELLRHAGTVIEKVFAKSLTYRTGGDEFAAILEGQDYENRHGLLLLFDEMVAQEHFTVAGDTLTLSVARGLGVHEPGIDFAAVSKKADAAMYNHKAAIKAKFGEEVR